MKIPMVQNTCCDNEEEKQEPCCPTSNVVDFGTIMGSKDSPVEVCCGGPPPPKSNPYELAGYTLCHYVHGFFKSGSDEIPLVSTTLSGKDHVGTIQARLGLNRDNYTVSPGLYGVGEPRKDSPVIVTANYKLTFDSVRKELKGIDAWLLVLDTCGINVWCAAGKGTFSTDELVERLEKTLLHNKIEHRKLILPQLGATGVSAQQIKKRTGFRVVYGPVRISDIKEFLREEKCDQKLRLVTFTFRERFELIPVEFYLFGKKVWWIFPILFLLSGIGPEIYDLDMVWARGANAAMAIILGGISGAMITPLLLPWIPGRAFAWKGLMSGFLFSIFFILFLGKSIGPFEKMSLICTLIAISSYLAMNFTGSTPYTSPSGVEKEMKIAIPLQAVLLIGGALLWIAAPFLQ